MLGRCGKVSSGVIFLLTLHPSEPNPQRWNDTSVVLWGRMSDKDSFVSFCQIDFSMFPYIYIYIHIYIYINILYIYIHISIYFQDFPTLLDPSWCMPRRSCWRAWPRAQSWMSRSSWRRFPMAFHVDNPHQITTFGMFVMQYINTINLVFFHISSKIGRGCRISVMASWTHFLAWEVPFFRPQELLGK